MTFRGDSVVNFIDFAQFAAVWKSSNSPAITLDDDNDVDIEDLALFCEDWLWVAPCSELYQMFLDQQENSGMEMTSQSATETVVLVEKLPATPVIEEPPLVEELAAVQESAVSEETIEQESVPYNELIPELLEWIDQLWQSGEFGGSEEEYLELRRIIQEPTE